jgi:WD40 repeat protein
MNATATLAAGAVAAIDDFPVALCWVPDGSALIVGGGEGGIFRVAGNGAVQKLGEHAPGVLALAFQPKGRTLASAGQDGSVRLWDVGAGVATVEPLTAIRSKGWPAGLAWRADGAALAFASGKEVWVCDANGAATQQVGGHNVSLSQIAWRGRSEIVATGNGCSLTALKAARWSSSFSKAHH